MDWLKEMLKKAGLDESKLDETIGEINKELPKHFVPKSQYNDLSEARKKLETDLKDRDKQLDDLKKSAGDNAALKEQIEKLQTDNKAAKEKYEAEVKELRLNTAVKLVLSGKVHDPDIVAGLLDKTKIELDDAGSIKSGLEDQIKALQSSKAFLFVEKPDDKTKQPQFKGAKPADGLDKNDPPKPQSLAEAVAAHYISTQK
ncbi:phage scaffolding protein [Paenibacillus naphthalenovorans]|uniref:phage scaffolding protein n=1 Tax=Paenibacillus naphthalenovorans TaxID=162209 RepID=UPI00088D90B8|nr:phage scaffolding protein [Paenibacillus naphthalenovorans]SDJ76639.1 Phage minor structural protein GP20 [Paenibacillus naphthalenovorans]